MKKRNETSVVNFDGQLQNDANNGNLKEWARPEMMELKVNLTAGDLGGNIDGIAGGGDS